MVEILTGFTREIAIRSVLLGVMQSDTTGILYNTAAQFAQKQYGPAIRQLEKGAVQAGRLFFKALESFADDDEDIPVVFSDADNKTYRLDMKKKDVHGWSRFIQARIDLAIPVNEGADITNARLLTDPQNPLLPYEDVAARYLHIENPAETEDKILRGLLRRAIWPQLIQLVIQEGIGLYQAPQNPEQLSQMFSELPPQVQQVIGRHAQSIGQQVPNMAPNLARGQSNIAKGGRGQQMSQTRASELSSESSTGY